MLFFPLHPTACALPVLPSPSQGTSAGLGMDFVALERSSHILFGFPLNTCMVCLLKPLPCPFGCLIPEVFDPCGFGCVLGRGFFSLLCFLAPGNELLFPEILTHFPQREMLPPPPFPAREMLCCGRCWIHAGSLVLFQLYGLTGVLAHP